MHSILLKTHHMDTSSSKSLISTTGKYKTLLLVINIILVDGST